MATDDESRAEAQRKLNALLEGLGRDGRSIIGARARPRTLLWIENEGIRQRLLDADLFPTAEVLEDTSEIVEGEWDLLVTDRSLGHSAHKRHTAAWEPRDGLYVISFATGPIEWGHQPGLGEAAVHPSLAEEEDDPTGTLRWQGTTPATEFHIPGNLADYLERLVRRDLVPRAQENAKNPYLESTGPIMGLHKQVLLSSGDHRILAGFFKRRGSKTELLALPPGVALLEEWVVAAMRRWREQNPSVFAQLPDWRSDPQWATAGERELIASIEQLRAEHRTRVEAFETKLKALEAELANSRADLSTSPRRLLLSVKDELVGAVADALRGLGFDVEDRDESAESGRYLEDLRIRDPSDPDWVALVEVRGYSAGGAKASDLPRLGRFALEYSTESGEPPSALWYVVNQFAGRDPGARPPVLHSEEPTLREYAKEHRLLALDTAELFNLTVAVDEHVVERGEARRMLRETTGRTQFDVPSDGA